VTVYDSLPDGNTSTELWTNNFVKILNDRTGLTGPPPFRHVEIAECKVQPNGKDCGLYTIFNFCSVLHDLCQIAPPVTSSPSVSPFESLDPGKMRPYLAALILDSVFKNKETELSHFREDLIAQIAALPPLHDPSATLPSIPAKVGTTILSDFNDKKALESLVTLFPFGLGFLPPDTAPSANMVNHFARQFDARFQTSHVFLFSQYSTLTRLRTCGAVKGAVMSDRFKEGRDLHDQLPSILASLEREPNCQESLQKLKEIQRTLSFATGTVPWSDAEKASTASMIYSMMAKHGLPTFFITFSPDDTNNALTLTLSGCKLASGTEEPSPDHRDVKMFRIPLPESAERSRYWKTNPILHAMMFQHLCSAVFQYIFVCKEASVTRNTPTFIHLRERGVFGRARAFFSVLECQMRGSLHVHSLLWTTLQLDKITSFLQDEIVMDHIAKVIDSIVQAYIPDIHEVQSRTTHSGPAFTAAAEITPVPLPTDPPGANRSV